MYRDMLCAIIVIGKYYPVLHTTNLHATQEPLLAVNWENFTAEQSSLKI